MFVSLSNYRCSYLATSSQEPLDGARSFTKFQEFPFRWDCSVRFVDEASCLRDITFFWLRSTI